MQQIDPYLRQKTRIFGPPMTLAALNYLRKRPIQDLVHLTTFSLTFF